MCNKHILSIKTLNLTSKISIKKTFIEVKFLALVGQRLLANQPAQTSIEATSMFILIDVGSLALVGQRLLANLPPQTSIEATSIDASTATV